MGNQAVTGVLIGDKASLVLQNRDDGPGEAGARLHGAKSRVADLAADDLGT